MAIIPEYRIFFSSPLISRKRTLHSFGLSISSQTPGTDKHPSSKELSSSAGSNISGLIKKCGSRFSLSLPISITNNLLGIPICIAASPIPGAAYIVSSMSLSMPRILLSIASTGLDTVFNKGLGTVIISLIAISLDKPTIKRVQARYKGF